jgi:hypothetical protein
MAPEYSRLLTTGWERMNWAASFSATVPFSSFSWAIPLSATCVLCSRRTILAILFLFVFQVDKFHDVRVVAVHQDHAGRASGVENKDA